MFQPRIIHKGIALALIPLAVNTIWIFLLSSSLEHARDLLTKEHDLAVVLTHINQLTVLVAKSFGQLTSYASSGNEAFREEVLSLTDQTRSEVIKIQKLSDADDRVIDWTRQVEATMDEDLLLLETVRGQENSEVGLRKRVKRLRSLIKQAGSKNRILMQIMQEKQYQLDMLKDQETATEEYVRNIVICGLISNFGIALILIMLVVSDIRSRLRVLVENAHMLPRNIALTRKVGGSDELSELDAEIHAASTQLIESAEYRRGLMQMMAHDLKSPLAGCMVSVQLLVERPSERSPIESKQLKLIENNLKTSVDLINDLLLLESLEVGQLVLDSGPESLRELIDTAIDTVTSLAEVKQLSIENAAEKIYVNVDRKRLLQVLTNLLSNAIKFSRVGTTINVLTNMQGKVIEVAVRDHGPGLEPKHQVNLFQKFHQTPEGKKAGGTGLGLAISKLIVESHGGTIGVRSEPGKGSDFWFTIPTEPLAIQS